MKKLFKKNYIIYGFVIILFLSITASGSYSYFTDNSNITGEKIKSVEVHYPENSHHNQVTDYINFYFDNSNFSWENPAIRINNLESNSGFMKFCTVENESTGISSGSWVYYTLGEGELLKSIRNNGGNFKLSNYKSNPNFYTNSYYNYLPIEESYYEIEPNVKDIYINNVGKVVKKRYLDGTIQEIEEDKSEYKGVTFYVNSDSPVKFYAWSASTKDGKEELVNGAFPGVEGKKVVIDDSTYYKYYIPPLKNYNTITDTEEEYIIFSINGTYNQTLKIDVPVNAKEVYYTYIRGDSLEPDKVIKYFESVEEDNYEGVTIYVRTTNQFYFYFWSVIDGVSRRYRDWPGVPGVQEGQYYKATINRKTFYDTKKINGNTYICNLKFYFTDSKGESETILIPQNAKKVYYSFNYSTKKYEIEKAEYYGSDQMYYYNAVKNEESILDQFKIDENEIGEVIQEDVILDGGNNNE